MQSIFSDISELLTAVDVADGDVGKIHFPHHFLKACEPSLLLLADADGELALVDDFDEETSLEDISKLTSRLFEELAERRTCKLEAPAGGVRRWAFAVRLPNWAHSAIAACVVRSLDSHVDGTDAQDAPFVLCTALYWAAAFNKTRYGEMRTRVKHLQAEHETLKNSQTMAVAAAIEEREKRLHQQQQDMAQLTAIMKLAADGIVTANEAGIIESFNKAAGMIFGYDPLEAIGQNISLLAPAADQHSHPEHLAKCLKSGGSCISGKPHETIGKRKDGTLFPLEIAVSEVPLDSGSIVTGIFRDIADRRRLESQLLQAQKMESVGQLAAGIAHEINTPIQYVGDNTRFLEDAFNDSTDLLIKCKKLCEAADRGEELGELAAAVAAAAKNADIEYLISEVPKAIAQSLEGVERVGKIVRSMKEFSHPGSEIKQAVDLNRALESTLTVCRNEWKYVAEAITDFDPDLPPVSCLPGECNQVFLNLIINAAHAIINKLGDNPQKKGTITVATRRDGDWVEIRITDTGTGIPPSYRTKIFDPFFTTKEVGRGTGQGLAISHSVITKRHNGTIYFETEVGKGTAFIVRLPISGDCT